jgi:hypothetical protein
MSKICDDICSEVIAEALEIKDVSKKVEGYQRFALLWRLTGELGTGYRPFSSTLFLLLDSLNDEDPSVKYVTSLW